MTHEKWSCPVKKCGWWVGPWDNPMLPEVTLFIIDHLAKHIADPTYRFKKEKKKT